MLHRIKLDANTEADIKKCGVFLKMQDGFVDFGFDEPELGYSLDAPDYIPAGSAMKYQSAY
uniref:hypothetical protein n=1 Tax=Staphylococcus aureus TaxID=1280 RepID=UPI0015837197